MKEHDKEEFKPTIIGPGPETGMNAHVLTAMHDYGATVLLVDDQPSYRSDIMPEIKKLAAKPIVIAHTFKSRGKGTNLTPPKKKRKKRS